jgi:ubiquinone/menaquinone biosynthesis C-methylase UbiE
MLPPMKTTGVNDEFSTFEHGAWKHAAGAYAQHWTSLTSQTVPFLLDAVRTETGSTLLDIACGPGDASVAAVVRGAEVTGIDFSEEMLAIASARNASVDFRIGDACALEFPDNTFDAVIMNFGMLHLPDPDLAIREAARVVKRGGTFAFTVWASPEMAKGFEIVLSAVAAHGKPVTLPSAPDFFRFADESNARVALEQAGLANASTRQLPLTWNLPAASTLYDAYFHGTARTGALLRQQDEDAQHAIARAVTTGAEAWTSPDGDLAIPMPAMMSAGTKP